MAQNPRQNFIGNMMPRHQIAAALNRFITAHKLQGIKQYAPNDDRLTDNVCRTFCDHVYAYCLDYMDDDEADDEMLDVAAGEIVNP